MTRSKEPIAWHEQARRLIPMGWYYFDVKTTSRPLYKLQYGVNEPSATEIVNFSCLLQNTKSDHHESPIDGTAHLEITGKSIEGNDVTNGENVENPAGALLPHCTMGSGKIYYRDYCNPKGSLNESPSLEFRFDLELRMSHALNIDKFLTRMSNSLFETINVGLFLSDHGLTTSDYDYLKGESHIYLPVKILHLELSPNV